MVYWVLAYRSKEGMPLSMFRRSPLRGELRVILFGYQRWLSPCSYGYGIPSACVNWVRATPAVMLKDPGL